MKTVKTKIIIVLTIGIMTAFNGCEHDSFIQTVCGVENPTKNLPWLKNSIDNFKTSTTSVLTSINLYKYKSTDIIEMTWNLIGIADVPTGALFTCTGERLYSCGGLQQFDSCNYVLNNSNFINVLWKKE
jgi:hypothetical protein